MTVNPEDFGLTPEVLAWAEETAAAARPLLTSIGPVMDIIERQRSAMSAMEESYRLALTVVPPPASRRQLAELVHAMRVDSLATAAPVMSQAEAEQAVLNALPRTDEEVEELRQGVADIQADPDLTKTLSDAGAGVSWWAEVREMAPWVLLVWLGQRLLEAANAPVTEHMTADQAAASQNRFAALAILVALAAIILARKQD